jgi:colicin import membrane protein
MTNEIAVIKDETALVAFSQDAGLESIINDTRIFVRSFKHDVSTEAGRKKTKSLAFKVSKLKTKLDALGKSLTDDWAQKKKSVDDNRRSMREDLDKLKVEALKPVTEWEDNQKKVYAKQMEDQRLADISEQKESDHEIALLYADKFDRDLADSIEIEKQRKIDEEAQRKINQDAYDKKIAQEATAKVIADAAAKEIESARLLEEQKRLNQQIVDANIRKQKQSLLDAAKLVEDARLKEIKRQKDEQQALDQAKIERAADVENISQVRRSIKEKLMTFNIDQETAIKIVLSIHKNEFPSLTINY